MTCQETTFYSCVRVLPGQKRESVFDKPLFVLQVWSQLLDPLDESSRFDRDGVAVITLQARRLLALEVPLPLNATQELAASRKTETLGC